MRSQQIARQISDLEARRTGVVAEVARAEARLSEARRKALSGQPAAADVTAAQSEYDALAGLLGEADGQLGDLRLKLQEAEAEESRLAAEARARELDAERKANAEAFDARLASLDEYLRSAIPSLVAELDRDAELGARIAALGGASGVANLGARRWSDSRLRYAQHIALMIAEAKREEERRRVKAGLARPAARARGAIAS